MPPIGRKPVIIQIRLDGANQRRAGVYRLAAIREIRVDSETSSGQQALLVGLLVMPVIVVIAVVLAVVGGVVWLTTASALPPTPAAVVATASEPPLAVVNRLVVVNAEGQLETMTPEGGDRRTLTNGPYVFQFPAWSPDGRSLAAIGVSRDAGGVFVLSDSADSPIPLYLSQERYPIYLYWSPDSRQVSFIADDPDAGIALYLAPRDGSQAARLLASGRPFYWDWAADSTELFLHTGFVNSRPRLSLWNLAQDVGGEELATPGYFQSPDISAGGRYLAYTEAPTSSDRQVVVADRRTGERLTVPHRGLAAFGWSPTAEQLLLMAGTGSAEISFGPLQLIDTPSGETRILTNAFAIAFFWSPDGRVVAYLSLHGQRPPSRDLLARPAGGAHRAALQPIQDGDLVLELWFVDVATGREQLGGAFRPTRQFISQFLPYFDQYAHSHALWAPDSQSLVLPVFTANADAIYRFFVDGRSPLPIARGSSAFWSRQ